MQGSHSEFVSCSDGYELEVFVFGNASAVPVVLIPPLTPHGVYQPLVDALSEHCRVICCTTRGLNGQIDFDPRDVDLSRHADDVVAVLDRFALPRETCVFGWCLGAMVALAAGYRFPERVGRLLLAAPPSGIPFYSGVDISDGAREMARLAETIWNNQSLADTLLDFTLNAEVENIVSEGRRFANECTNSVFLRHPSAFSAMFLMHHVLYRDDGYFNGIGAVEARCDVVFSDDDEMIPPECVRAVLGRLGNVCEAKKFSGSHYSLLVEPSLHRMIADMVLRT